MPICVKYALKRKPPGATTLKIHDYFEFQMIKVSRTPFQFCRNNKSCRVFKRLLLSLLEEECEFTSS